MNVKNNVFCYELIEIYYKDNNNNNNNKYNKGIFIKNIIFEFNRNKTNNNSIINIFENKLNEIRIIDIMTKGDQRIKIFGKKFIENYKNKFK